MYDTGIHELIKMLLILSVTEKFYTPEKKICLWDLNLCLLGTTSLKMNSLSPETCSLTGRCNIYSFK